MPRLSNSPPPELLSPAGDWEALRAAVGNGADAVYFGLSNFNARHRAANFTLDELPRVIGHLHDRNVRGYVTLNTLIFSNELAEVANVVAGVARAGADAVIVQDLGLARLVHRLAPELPIHGSTQMTLSDARGIETARELGIARVILARELSMDDIAQIVSETDLPVEVFVHGALCVAYSGQCLTSEALGGRSANRGQCAQACRLPYELIVDGVPRDLGDKAYLLSPQDLAAPELIAPMIDLGVACFKIEGRLKSAQYVAATTQTYRAAIDAALAGRAFAMSAQEQIDLAQSFSRGFTNGFLSGVNHQELVAGRFPKSRGVRAGVVHGKNGASVIVQLDMERDATFLKPGDGVVFDEGHPEQDEQGGRIVAVEVVGKAENGKRKAERETSAEAVAIRFRSGDVNFSAIAPGAVVWRTDDPALRKRLERSYASDRPVGHVPLTFHARGNVGEAFALHARDDCGREVSASWPGPLQSANKHPLTVDFLKEQLNRLGDTPFELAGVTIDVPDLVMVPKSVLNDLRRQVVADLLRQRAASQQVRAIDLEALDALRAETGHALSLGDRAHCPAWHVLVRSLDQLEAVLEWHPLDELPPPEMIYCDFEELRRYSDAVELGRRAGRPIGLAPPRILKPGEEGLLALVARCDPDAVLVRNLSTLTYFCERCPNTQLIGDYSLNAANELTAAWLMQRGVARLVPSYDLNWDQLAALLRRFPADQFEVVIHQHMPMFHMEHCVFAATLSQGKDWRDCGRPCDVHRVELKDRAGAAFPLVADTGCRNTVFNSVAQSAAEYVARLVQLGVRQFRVELLRESREEVAPLLERYARVVAGRDSGRQTWRGLQVLNQLGVTRGTWRAD